MQHLWHVRGALWGMVEHLWSVHGDLWNMECIHGEYVDHLWIICEVFMERSELRLRLWLHEF